MAITPQRFVGDLRAHVAAAGGASLEEAYPNDDGALVEVADFNESGRQGPLVTALQRDSVRGTTLRR